MASIPNNLPLRLSPMNEGVRPSPRNVKIIDLLKQVEYIKKQLKQLLDT